MSKSASRLFLVTIVSLSVLCAAACGSIANGSSQKVPVVSMPAGATVISDCGKGPKPAGETPVVVKVSRKADRCIITVKKDGYAEESVVLNRRLSGWVWGNIFLPYVTVPGFLIDLYDGGAYRRSPESVEVHLRQEAASLKVAEEPVTP
jgi:hypothetical protein